MSQVLFSLSGATRALRGTHSARAPVTCTDIVAFTGAFALGTHVLGTYVWGAWSRVRYLCQKYTALVAVSALLCLGFVVLGLLAGFVPQREDPEVRRRVSPAVAVLHAIDMPPLAGQSFAPDRGYALRRAVSPLQALPAQLTVPDENSRSYGERPVGSHGEQGNSQHLVMFLDEGVSLATVDGPKALEALDMNAPLTPLLPLDGSLEAPLLATFQPAEYGESLDSTGQPLRWKEQYYASLRRVDPECQPAPERVDPAPLEKALLAALPALRSGEGASRPSLRPFDSENTFTRARRYKHLIEQAAQRFGLNHSLVYAIIHNESNFAPLLVSNRSAMGLMQLLPSTAGGEVHTFLYGHPGKVSFSDLSNPETNIRYGTAYLYLLLNRHLAQVRDAKSREYCAVASYNMGPNGFLRIFSADRDAAIEMINQMTPDEVYTRLTQHLPVMETRYFVAKVTRSRAEFAAFE